MFAVSVPTTLTEENEFAVPLTKLYLTVSEVGLVLAVGLPVFVFASVVTGGINIFSMIMLVAYFFIGAQVMTTLRKDKPASWIWDLRYKYGAVPEQRGWMLCTRNQQRKLLANPVPSPHKFLGQQKKGDLMVSDVFHRLLLPPGSLLDPPLLRLRSLILPRASWRVQQDDEAIASVDAPRGHFAAPQKGGYPAPIWFSPPDGFTRGAIGYEDVVRPRIPWSITVEPPVE
ncbi:MAG: TIGR03750 family conjugal transfer protein [Rectinema sp.]|nr:TIGR03750 family conjugal transfer protein [Rectinema sp.]